jgi:hypothetical protein
MVCRLTILINSDFLCAEIRWDLIKVSEPKDQEYGMSLNLPIIRNDSQINCLSQCGHHNPNLQKPSVKVNSENYKPLN